MPLKKKKKIAEALILESSSIREAAEQTGTAIGTMGNISIKNLQSKQLDYLKSFRDEYRYYSSPFVLMTNPVLIS